MAVGIAVVKMKTHARIVALCKWEKEKNGKKFSTLVLLKNKFSTSHTLRHFSPCESTSMKLDELRLESDQGS